MCVAHRAITSQVVLQKEGKENPDCDVLKHLDVVPLLEGLANNDAVRKAKVKSASSLKEGIPCQDVIKPMDNSLDEMGIRLANVSVSYNLRCLTNRHRKLTPPLAMAISQAQTEQLQQELAFHSQVFDRKMKEMRAALADGTEWPVWLGVSKDAAIKVGGR